MRLAPATTTLVYENTDIALQSQASLSLAPGASINSDTSNSQILVAARARLLIGRDLTGDSMYSDNDGAGKVNSISIGLNTAPDSNVTVCSSTTFRSSSLFHEMNVLGAASVTLYGQQPNTNFTFIDSLQLTSSDSKLTIQSASVHMTATSPSSINSISVEDGLLHLHAQLNVGTLTLGSSRSTATLHAAGQRITADTLELNSGDITAESICVSNSLKIDGSATKTLKLTTLELLPASLSTISASTLRWDDNARFLIDRNATLIIGPSVQIQPVMQHNGAASKASEASMPIIENNGEVRFDGSTSGSTVVSIALSNQGIISIANRQSVTFNSLMLSGHSSPLQLSGQSEATLNCPQNATISCTYGPVTGIEGSMLTINLGQHDFYAPVNVSSLTVLNGPHNNVQTGRRT